MSTRNKMPAKGNQRILKVAAACMLGTALILALLPIFALI